MSVGENRQRPSAMPFQRYVPYQKQFAVDLPDRRWPSRVVTTAPRWWRCR